MRRKSMDPYLSWCKGKCKLKKINLPVELVVFVGVTVVADCGVCVNDTLKKQNFP